jgi:fused signal recognition particle receptor
LSEALGEEVVWRVSPPPRHNWQARPAAILVVGVNGGGKTTTIAKISPVLSGEGHDGTSGGADTLRAAATGKLQPWGGALRIDVISDTSGSDLGTAACNAVKAGITRSADIASLSTAGGLLTRTNLMEALKNVQRVTGKVLPRAPHAVWLVVDATSGQNALAQARSFKDAAGVSAVIPAKLDASARGGMAFSIQDELNLPIPFVGVGENVEDPRPFEGAAFVAGIMLQSG